MQPEPIVIPTDKATVLVILSQLLGAASSLLVAWLITNKAWAKSLSGRGRMLLGLAVPVALALLLWSPLALAGYVSYDLAGFGVILGVGVAAGGGGQVYYNAWKEFVNPKPPAPEERAQKDEAAIKEALVQRAAERGVMTKPPFGAVCPQCEQQRSYLTGHDTLGDVYECQVCGLVFHAPPAAPPGQVGSTAISSMPITPAAINGNSTTTAGRRRSRAAKPREDGDADTSNRLPPE